MLSATVTSAAQLGSKQVAQIPSLYLIQGEWPVSRKPWFTGCKRLNGIARMLDAMRAPWAVGRSKVRSKNSQESLPKWWRADISNTRHKTEAHNVELQTPVNRVLQRIQWGLKNYRAILRVMEYGLCLACADGSIGPTFKQICLTQTGRTVQQNPQ